MAVRLKRILPASWSPECWSISYLAARVEQKLYRIQHPHDPWLTPEANRLLEEMVKPDQQVVEFGSGKSTCYLAQRAAHVTSVETSLLWAERVAGWIRDQQLGKKVDLILAGADEVSLPEAVDGVLVDGGDRLQHTLWATDHLRPGGWLIVDNINRFIPNNSIGPGSIRDWEEALVPEWQSWWERVASWEQHWTTNGVTDTWLGQVPS